MNRKLLRNVFLIIVINISQHCGPSKEEREKIKQQNIEEFRDWSQLDHQQIFSNHKEESDIFFSPLEKDIIINHIKTSNDVKTIDELYNVYEKANSLLKTFNNKLNHILNIDTVAPKIIKDIRWMEEIIPNLKIVTLQNVSYKIRINYKNFLSLSKNTSSKEDDNFARLMLKVYPEGNFYPHWNKIIINDGIKICFNIGNNLSFKILKEADKLLTKDTPFKNEIQRIKSMCLSQISRSSSYCNNKRKSHREIENIIEAIQLTSHEKQELESLLDEIKPNSNNTTKRFNVSN